MCVGVEDELCCEDAGEENVHPIKEETSIGEGAVISDQLAVELRLRDVDEEVLRAGRAAESHRQGRLLISMSQW